MSEMKRTKRILLSITAVACCANGLTLAADPLPIYQPKVKLAGIYFHHPGAKPAPTGVGWNQDLSCAKTPYDSEIGTE